MLRPLAHDRGALLARRHPLARIGAALLLMLALFVSRGIPAPALGLAAVAAAAFASGVDGRALLRRSLPVAAAASGIGVFNAVVSGDAIAGLAVALRLAGIALAGIVALATIEPTELADALVQHLRVSPRFAVGALAALRLLPLFAREWEIRGLARRARGLEAGRGLITRLAEFPGRTHGLLVAAVRRAVALALAMDARGFGTKACRTIARPRAFDRRDAAMLIASLAVSLAVIAAGFTR